LNSANPEGEVRHDGGGEPPSPSMNDIPVIPKPEAIMMRPTTWPDLGDEEGSALRRVRSLMALWPTAPP